MRLQNEITYELSKRICDLEDRINILEIHYQNLSADAQHLQNKVIELEKKANFLDGAVFSPTLVYPPHVGP